MKMNKFTLWIFAVLQTIISLEMYGQSLDPDALRYGVIPEKHIGSFMIYIEDLRKYENKNLNLIVTNFRNNSIAIMNWQIDNKTHETGYWGLLSRPNINNTMYFDLNAYLSSDLIGTLLTKAESSSGATMILARMEKNSIDEIYISFEYKNWAIPSTGIATIGKVFNPKNINLSNAEYQKNDIAIIDIPKKVVTSTIPSTSTISEPNTSIKRQSKQLNSSQKDLQKPLATASESAIKTSTKTGGEVKPTPKNAQYKSTNSNTSNGKPNNTSDMQLINVQAGDNDDPGSMIGVGSGVKIPSPPQQ